MHQEVNVPNENPEPLPVIYIDKITSEHFPDERYYNAIKIKFSDGSEELHRNVQNVTMVSLNYWMKNKVPLHRFEGGTLVEAEATTEEHRRKLFRFFEEVFEERCYSARKFAGGEQAQLEHIDDQRNGASDFVTYITHYLGNWYSDFPPHGIEDLERFQQAMVKVAHLAYAAHGWTERRKLALEIEAQARAGAGSKVTMGEGN